MPIPAGIIIFAVIAGLRAAGVIKAPAPGSSLNNIKFEVSPHAILKVVGIIVLVPVLIFRPQISFVSVDSALEFLSWLLAFLGLTLYQMPTLLLRNTTVKWGWVKITYYASRILGCSWFINRVQEHACLLAAHALTLQQSSSSKVADVAFLVRRMQKGKVTSAARYAAQGLLSAHAQDFDTAKRAFALVDTLSAAITTRYARSVARRWLVADAATRGEWKTVQAFAKNRRGKHDALLAALGDPWLMVMYALACIRTGTGRVPGEKLSFYTRVYIAYNHSLREFSVRASRVSTPSECPPSEDVFAEHARLLTAPCPSAERVMQHAQSLEALLNEDPAFIPNIQRRALALNANVAVSDLADEVRTAMADDLSAMLLRGRIALQPFLEEEGMLQAAAERAQNEYLKVLEDRVTDLSDRTEAKMELSPEQEAYEFTGVRLAYMDAALLCGEEIRMQWFRRMHRVVCNHGVWLDNRFPKVRHVAHASFKWSLEEALVLEAADLVELQQKNSDITK
jgi:hypothetical protein